MVSCSQSDLSSGASHSLPHEVDFESDNGDLNDLAVDLSLSPIQPSRALYFSATGRRGRALHSDEERENGTVEEREKS